MSLLKAIKNKIANQVRKHILNFQTHISHVPYIGPFLEKQINKAIKIDNAQLLHVFNYALRGINLEISDVELVKKIKTRLGILCENQNPNNCINGYLVRDSNKSCIISLMYTMLYLIETNKLHNHCFTARGLNGIQKVKATRG